MEQNVGVEGGEVGIDPYVKLGHGDFVEGRFGVMGNIEHNVLGTIESSGGQLLWVGLPIRRIWDTFGATFGLL